MQRSGKREPSGQKVDGQVIYPQMPFDNYLLVDALSRTMARTIVEDCPAARWLEKEETPALALGTGAHTAILEWPRFLATYKVSPMSESSPDKAARRGSKAWDAAEAAAKSAGRVLVKPDEYAAIVEMRESVMRNREAADLLGDVEYEQIELTMTCEIAGVDCKVRLDALTKGMAVVDLKTTQSAKPQDFEKSVDIYWYDAQAWLIQEACIQNDIPVGLHLDFHFYIIAIEARGIVEVYKLEQEAIDLGEKKIRAGVALWKKCRELNRWPSYNCDRETLLPVPSYIGVTDYAKRRWMDRQIDIFEKEQS